jgi:hypothetical protein
MQTPVDSMALLIPFQEASILYFCLAVRGSLGSTVAGGAASSGFRLLPEPPLEANLPNSHPIVPSPTLIALSMTLDQVL